MAGKEEITRPPALVAGSSLPTLAIRPLFYASLQVETVLFCTLSQVIPENLRHAAVLQPFAVVYREPLCPSADLAAPKKSRTDLEMCAELNSVCFAISTLFRLNGIPAIHLGRKDMKSRPVFLLCGAILIASLPVRADSLIYTGATNESAKTEMSATDIRGSVTKFTMPATADIASEPLSAVAQVSGSEFDYVPLRAESPNSPIVAKPYRGSVLALDAAQNDVRLSDPTPAVAFIGSFGPG